MEFVELLRTELRMDPFSSGVLGVDVGEGMMTFSVGLLVLLFITLVAGMASAKPNSSSLDPFAATAAAFDSSSFRLCLFFDFFDLEEKITLKL